jgi:hypothetical protein
MFEEVNTGRYVQVLYLNRGDTSGPLAVAEQFARGMQAMGAVREDLGRIGVREDVCKWLRDRIGILEVECPSSMNLNEYALGRIAALWDAALSMERSNL